MASDTVVVVGGTRGLGRAVAEFYADAGRQSSALISALPALIAVFFFLWFLGGLRGLPHGAEGGPTPPVSC